MDEAYKEWYQKLAQRHWVPSEPCTYDFATSPWEGEISIDNVGKTIQYRGGEWQPFNSNQDK